MGQMTPYPIALPNQGIDISKPEQFLEAAYSPYSRNMEFYNELLQGRLGNTKFDTAALSGPVLLIDQYWKFTGSYDLIFATTKDIYKYDFGNSRYDILTPVYQTGTIEIQAGTPTIVRGTGTSWTTGNVKAGDFIKIGSGSIHTGSTWYEVASLNVGSQQITLTASGPTTAAGTAYVLRQIFNGTNTDIWQGKNFLDDAEGEVFIMVNGVDHPVWYNDSGQVQQFSALPTDFTSAKYLQVFGNRIVFLWTREAGQNQPIRYRWSAVANFQSYNDLDFQDLEKPTPAFWIKGSYIKGDFMIIPKESGAYVVSHIGGDEVFATDFSSTFAGNFSAYSILPLETGAFYFGYDNRFRFWNQIRDETPFDDIFDYLLSLSPSNSEYIFGYQVEGKKQLRWALPYDSVNMVSPVLVYDYGRQIIEIWDYTHRSWIRSIGEYLLVSDLYVDDPFWDDLYVDEESGFWDDRTFLANAPIILYGCEDGYVRKADIGSTDDGYAYTRRFRTKRVDFGEPHMRKRLWKQQWWMEAQTAGEVTLEIKRDDANAFEPLTKTIPLTNAGKDKVKYPVTWNKDFENAQFQLSATNQFNLLGFINWFSEKGKVVA